MQFNVRGFPTLKFLHLDASGNIKAADYSGGRSAKELVQWALQQAQGMAFGRLGVTSSSGSSAGGGRAGGGSGGGSCGGGGGGGAAGGGEDFYTGSEVVTLTDGNFHKQVVDSDDLWFVEVRCWGLAGLAGLQACVRRCGSACVHAHTGRESSSNEAGRPQGGCRTLLSPCATLTLTHQPCDLLFAALSSTRHGVATASAYEAGSTAGRQGGRQQAGREWGANRAGAQRAAGCSADVAPGSAPAWRTQSRLCWRLMCR